MQAATAWAIAVYPAAVHEVRVVVLDATTAAAEQVRAPAAAAVHRAWEVSEAVVAAAVVVAAAEALAAVAAEAVVAVVVVAVVAEAEGGNES